MVAVMEKVLSSYRAPLRRAIKVCLLFHSRRLPSDRTGESGGRESLAARDPLADSGERFPGCSNRGYYVLRLIRASPTLRRPRMGAPAGFLNDFVRFFIVYLVYCKKTRELKCNLLSVISICFTRQRQSEGKCLRLLLGYIIFILLPVIGDGYTK